MVLYKRHPSLFWYAWKPFQTHSFLHHHLLYCYSGEWEKNKYLYPSRGIRQRDPLSPYIFIMRMERLSRGIEVEVRRENWTPISISPKGPKLSHLFFADDLTFLSRADTRNCQTIARIFQNFSAISGQTINNQKSRVIYSTNCTPQVVNQCTQALTSSLANTLANILATPSSQSSLRIVTSIHYRQHKF